MSQTVALPKSINLGGKQLSFSQPILMGIINATPDSFSDGGAFSSVDSAIRQAEILVKGGATILDIGGESSRPGATPVDEATEKRRVLPIFEALEKEDFPVFLSVDTYKAPVAKSALESGATIINDITALRDPKMAATAAAHQAALIIMHMRGTPKTMQEGEINYPNLIESVQRTFRKAINTAIAAGVEPDKLMLDPGIGFGKTTTQNLQLTSNINQFSHFGCPIVYGPSRKRFIGEILNADITDRDKGTAAACTIAAVTGAHIFRVHNPDAVRHALILANAVRSLD